MKHSRSVSDILPQQKSKAFLSKISGILRMNETKQPPTYSATTPTQLTTFVDYSPAGDFRKLSASASCAQIDDDLEDIYNNDGNAHNNVSPSNNLNRGWQDGECKTCKIPSPPPLPRAITLQSYRASRRLEGFHVRVHYGDCEVDVVVNGQMKVCDIWEMVKAMKEIPDSTSLSIYDEKGALLPATELVANSKISKKSVLTIKARPKKEMSALMTFLNNFFPKRLTREELIIRRIIPTKTNTALPNPAIFRKCIDYMISTKAYEVEGIFRVSASALQMQPFYASLESGEMDFTKAVSLHIVPASLKQYLRSFPYGLIGPPLSTTMCNMLSESRETLPFELAKVVPQIPKECKEVLHLLFEFLLKVVEHKDCSLMNEQNCAIVFGPSVISFYGVDGDLLIQSQKSIQLLYTLLVNYAQIFGPRTYLSLSTSVYVAEDNIP